MAMTIDTTPSDKPFLSLGAGITRIDTGFFRKGMAACYLMERTNEQGIVEIAIVETGIAKTVPLLLQLIADKGYSVEQVKYVIPTHVHLDHAGGVGGLMSALPQATLVIHPQGARHPRLLRPVDGGARLPEVARGPLHEEQHPDRPRRG